jgi:hypothetical protein
MYKVTQSMNKGRVKVWGNHAYKIPLYAELERAGIPNDTKFW